MNELILTPITLLDNGKKRHFLVSNEKIFVYDLVILTKPFIKDLPMTTDHRLGIISPIEYNSVCTRLLKVSKVYKEITDNYSLISAMIRTGIPFKK